jgi:HEAT repeat protein
MREGFFFKRFDQTRPLFRALGPLRGFCGQLAWTVLIGVIALIVAPTALPEPAGSGSASSDKGRESDKTNDENQAEWYLQILRDNKVKTDDASILGYLKRISDHDDDLLKIDKLIQQFGDDDFDKRQDASRRLVDLGPVALPTLRIAREHEDRETARRVRECTHTIGSACFADVPLAAVRILVSRKLDGTVEALLGYLPYCIDEDLEWEIYTALEALGCQQGRVHPAIEKSLVDRMPARRAAAGCLLARLGNQQQHAAARKLLKDSDPLVRLRVA